MQCDAVGNTGAGQSAIKIMRHDKNGVSEVQETLESLITSNTLQITRNISAGEVGTYGWIPEKKVIYPIGEETLKQLLDNKPLYERSSGISVEYGNPTGEMILDIRNLAKKFIFDHATQWKSLEIYATKIDDILNPDVLSHVTDLTKLVISIGSGLVTASVENKIKAAITKSKGNIETISFPITNFEISTIAAQCKHLKTFHMGEADASILLNGKSSQTIAFPVTLEEIKMKIKRSIAELLRASSVVYKATGLRRLIVTCEFYGRDVINFLNIQKTEKTTLLSINNVEYLKIIMRYIKQAVYLVIELSGAITGKQVKSALKKYKPGLNELKFVEFTKISTDQRTKIVNNVNQLNSDMRDKETRAAESAKVAKSAKDTKDTKEADEIDEMDEIDDTDGTNNKRFKWEPKNGIDSVILEVKFLDQQAKAH